MNQTRHHATRVEFVGGGMGVGAALGLLFGLLLAGDSAVFVVLGATIGLGAGLAWDLDRD